MRRTPLTILILIIVLIAGAGYFMFRRNEPVAPITPVGNNEPIDEIPNVEGKTRMVTLYYYNEDKDKDAGGNVMCTDKGLVAVQREIPRTETPIQDAINLLLKGDLTVAEKTQGIDTEFPLNGLELRGASMNSGVLTLDFNDKENRTSGGACRVTILRAQIEKTAMQFDEVDSVRFIPEEVFQP